MQKANKSLTSELRNLQSMRLAINPLTKSMEIRISVSSLHHIRTIVSHIPKPPRQIRQQMKVRSKQRPTPIHPRQMIQTRKPQRNPILRRRPTAHLIHNDKRPLRRILQNLRTLQHLDHERRLVAREIVRRAHATKHLVDEPDLGVDGGHEGARLRENGDERVLAEEGAFAGHVGAGDEEDLLARVQVAVVGGEADALFAEAQVDHGMSAADDGVGGAVVEDGSGPVLHFGDSGVGAGHVQFVEDFRVPAKSCDMLFDFFA